MSDPAVLVLRPQGMSCTHCVAAVRDALESVPGVVVHDVAVGEARVSGDGLEGRREALAAALDEAGYPLAPAADSDRA